MNKIEKQKAAELEHRRFFDLIYPYFGLEEKPSYTKIVVQPLIGPGYLGPSSDIYLNITSSPEERVYTNWHESSHLLHYISNSSLNLGDVREHLDEEENYTFQKILLEMVADLGALVFLDLTEGINRETIEKYEPYLGPGRSVLSPEEFNALLRIAKTDKRLLEILAKGNDAQKLVDLVRSYS